MKQNIITKKSMPSYEQFPLDLRIKGSVAKANTAKFREKIDFVIDTGADISCIPSSILKIYGLDNFDKHKSVQISLADGNASNAQVVHLDLKLDCARGKNAYLKSIPFVVLPDADVALIGMNLLQLFEICISNGKLIMIQPIEEAFQTYQDSLKPPKNV